MELVQTGREIVLGLFLGTSRTMQGPETHGSRSPDVAVVPGKNAIVALNLAYLFSGFAKSVAKGHFI
jgi:hypothetical protein